MNYSIPLTLATCILISACGPEDAQPGRYDPIYNQVVEQDTWTRTNLSKVAVSGLLKPNVVAEKNGEIIHVGFMENIPNSTVTDIKYLQWSTELQSQVGENSLVQSIDNSATLATSVSPQGAPMLAYQGGGTRECQEDEQSDVMLSRLNTTWQEQTAAIGFVERNPGLHDGLAGGQVSMATDSFGTTHIVYQFFYEGCDANSFSYPDIKYIAISDSDSSLPPEETVDANIYGDEGHQLVTIRAGDYSDMVIDANNSPVIFYSAENNNDSKRGLKVATKSNSIWQNEWIEDDCLVDGVSAAVAPNGELGVSYYTTQCGSEAFQPQLHFAQFKQGVWRSEVVSTRNRSGQFPSLAFDSNNQPLIASLEKETHQGQALDNLLLSSKETGAWEFDVVSEGLEYGYYNSIWVDENNNPIILSYSSKLDTISLFIQ